MRPILTYGRVSLAIMSEAPSALTPDDALLDELAQLDMALARKVHARAMAAEDTDEINSLAHTYQRLARSLRQTLALKAQLKRQREQAARAASAAPRPRETGPVRNRKDDVSEAVLRVVWNEQEPCLKPIELTRELEERLDAMAAAGDFLETPLDDQIARLCAELDLPPGLSANWRDLPSFLFAEDEDEDVTDEEMEALRARFRYDSG